MGVLRKVRAVLGMALVWSVAWAPGGVIWALVHWARQDPSRWVGGRVQLPPIAGPVIMCASFGFIGGVAFAVALMMAERRRRGLAGLSLGRTALWGALGGLALPVLLASSAAVPTVPLLIAAGWSAAFGAGSAGGGLLLARRAPTSLVARSEVPALDAPDA